MILTLILVSGMACLLPYLVYIKRRYSFFRERNIPGPQPILFFGNTLEIYKAGGYSACIKQWSQRFGQTYGYFEGHTPVLVVSDPEILSVVFLNQFSVFHSRRQFPLEDRRKSKDAHLLSATDNVWQRQRKIISQILGPSKIKFMFPSIDECVSNLLQKLDETNEKCPEGFDIYKLYKRLTMDVICKFCFGVNSNIQNNPDNPYLIRSEEVFDREHATFVMALMSIFVPELQPHWLAIHCWANRIKVHLRRLLPMGERLIYDDPNEWLKDNIGQLIERTINDESHSIQHNENTEHDMSAKATDFLHLLLKTTKEYSNVDNQSSIGHLALTLNEVKQNIYLFMTAGYETTSTALAYATYVLATHPDEQRKLQEHINFYTRDDASLNDDLLKKMNYLDWFIRETLRMYPIAPIVVNRQSADDVDLPKLGRIPKGTNITLDMYSLHFNKELWGPEDPHIFYPERFASKRERIAWMAFGAGRRGCAGMSFALVEIKITLIRLLKIYNILPIQQESEKLETVELVTITPKKVPIRLMKRTVRS